MLLQYINLDRILFRRQKIFRVVIFVFLSMLCFLAKSANASCPLIQSVSVPSSIDINPTLPVGSVLSTTTLSWPMLSTTCGYTGYNIQLSVTGNGVPNGNLYPTGIPGLSYRGHVNGWTAPNATNYWPTYWSQDISGDLWGAGTLNFELVKTGPILPGTFPPKVVMIGSIEGKPAFEIKTASSIIVKPTVPSCTPTASVVNVALPTVTQESLVKIADVTGETSFSIDLNCDAPTNISLSFGGNVTNSSKAIYKNTNVTTGDSIGIQILRGSNPVPIGAGKNINLGTINGRASYEFSARYYALKAGVIPGKVSAISQVSIVYN